MEQLLLAPSSQRLTHIQFMWLISYKLNLSIFYLRIDEIPYPVKVSQEFDVGSFFDVIKIHVVQMELFKLSFLGNLPC